MPTRHLDLASCIVIISIYIFARKSAALSPRTRVRNLATHFRSTVFQFSTMATDEFGDGAFLADFDVDAAVKARNSTEPVPQDFGDGAFLADFDVDAAVKARKSTEPAAAAGDNKRLKVSPTSTATAPFSETSSFSIGHTTNPLTELASASDAPSPTAQPVSTSSYSTDEQALEATLAKYFGHGKFRAGQLQVLQAVLNGSDAAVFWATGSGKSICYQIPALHTGNVSLVVSPLISLMQDQVNKLNGLVQQPIATFLGSAQMDPSQEAAALNGQYRVVYVTPEKLLSGGFLDELARMHTSVCPLSCVAIDESHCVSEWGHSFRADYRQLHQVRNHSVLSQVPLVALTATAVPRVQDDILSSLQLRNPLIARQSFDRDNLKIEIHKKKGLHAAMNPLLDKMAMQSTIIYAPTRDQVEEITRFLAPKLKVEAYHAGLTNEQRHQAHVNFLVGTTKVIVATVAFGMGIDKPDTRRVIHYGPPKTVEEYYQQIGRAGRDGLPAECIMYVSEADFDKYKSDFYVGDLHGEVKANTLKSVDTLKSFALDPIKCRRKALLDFFQEEASFGERCGTCDTCQRVSTYGEDAEREAVGGRIVLKAIDALSEQGLGTIEKVIAGNVVEPYRYRYGRVGNQVQAYIQQQRRDLKIRVPASHFRELIAPLVSKGLVSQGSKSAEVNGYKRTWTTYSLTTQGTHVLNDTSIPIVLPVTETIREIERKEEEKRQRVLKQLSDAGVKIDKLPEEEVKTGDGEVIRVFTKWHNYLESMRRGGRDERLAQLEDLLARIESWRLSVAQQYQMAPAAVLAEHTMMSLVYAIATLKPGFKAEPGALISAGVRSRELGSLIDVLNQWIEEAQPASIANEMPVDDAAMVFPSGSPVVPEKPWEYAVYKPMKKTGLASWESSHQRFLQGEHPQAISISPANGKPIQMATVVSHVLDGLVQGRSVPLDRLAMFMPPPSKSEWDQLRDAEASTGIDVAGDPNTSGPGGSKFTMTEFLRPIMGDAFADTPYNERTDQDREKFGHWCNSLKWFMALRRIGYEPTFAE